MSTDLVVRFSFTKRQLHLFMDDDYYQFTISHSKLTRGIRHADSAALIALKSRAYLNLMNDKAAGKHVNSRDIKKHRSDVLKLAHITIKAPKTHSTAPCRRWGSPSFQRL